MNDIYIFLIRNDIWIYIVCLFGLFWYLTQFFQARGMLRRAMFGLEKERGKAIRNTAVVSIMSFTAVISLVYYVNAQIAPTLPAELLKPPTPTPNIFATPLSSPTPLGIAAPTATLGLVPTVTLPGQGNDPLSNDTATESETAVPDIPIITTPTISCIPQLNITEPRDGAAVAGLVTFNGTANTDHFQLYRLEANGPETNGQWASLLATDVTQPIIDGFLGQVNLQDWANGPYLVRLTAVDILNNPTNICVIQVTLN